MTREFDRKASMIHEWIFILKLSVICYWTEGRQHRIYLWNRARKPRIPFISSFFLRQGSSGQTFWGVVCLAAFLFQNNLQKLCTPTQYFQKLIFSLKTLEIGKLSSTTTKCFGFQYHPPFSTQLSLNFKPRALEPALLTAYLWCNISLFYSAVPGCYRNWSTVISSH